LGTGLRRNGITMKATGRGADGDIAVPGMQLIEAADF
jgi:hypothetical protein